MDTTTSAFRVTFSIFGADALPAWRRAIVSSVVVQAATADQARDLAGYGAATYSVSPA